MMCNNNQFPKSSNPSNAAKPKTLGDYAKIGFFTQKKTKED